MRDRRFRVPEKARVVDSPGLGAEKLCHIMSCSGGISLVWTRHNVSTPSSFDTAVRISRAHSTQFCNSVPQYRCTSIDFINHRGCEMIHACVQSRQSGQYRKFPPKKFGSNPSVPTRHCSGPDRCTYSFHISTHTIHINSRSHPDAFDSSVSIFKILMGWLLRMNPTARGILIERIALAHIALKGLPGSNIGSSSLCQFRDSDILQPPQSISDGNLSQSTLYLIPLIFNFRRIDAVLVSFESVPGSATINVDNSIHSHITFIKITVGDKGTGKNRKHTRQIEGCRSSQALAQCDS